MYKSQGTKRKLTHNTRILPFAGTPRSNCCNELVSDGFAQPDAVAECNGLGGKVPGGHPELLEACVKKRAERAAGGGASLPLTPPSPVHTREDPKRTKVLNITLIITSRRMSPCRTYSKESSMFRGS